MNDQPAAACREVDLIPGPSLKKVFAETVLSIIQYLERSQPGLLQLLAQAMSGRSITFQPGDPCPDLLTADEAARYVRLDTVDIKNPTETLERYRKGGSLHGIQISKKVFYRRQDLDKFIEELYEENPR
jgi:hypothetical protein